MEAIYRVSGQHVETRASAAGPWAPSTQHGAAPSALIAWAAEHLESGAPMHIARLTLDLLRPVPVAPLEIRSAILRQGRNSQVTQIILLAQGAEVVRASVLKLRRSSPPLPPGLREPPLDLPGPELSHELCDQNRIRCPFLGGVAARLAGERERRPGPTAMWFRAFRPIIEGEAISPAMRAAIAADFCNGVSSALDMGQWSFINADVTLSLVRLPVGEWILVNAETSLGPDGGGIAVARLGDTSGYFGRAAQSLVIEHR